MILDPLQDGHSALELIDSMGSDLSVVNDARVSYNRESSELTDRDIKLIEYLIKNDHTSPLRGVVLKFKVTIPLFCARQWWKHCVSSSYREEQLGWNETSLRYVEMTGATCKAYIPSELRKQSQKNKQGSEGVLDPELHREMIDLYMNNCAASMDAYNRLITSGVCREQARAILCPAIYTQFIWTTSLQATLHFIHLRKDKNAQPEIAKYAEGILKLIDPIVPHTIAAYEKILRNNY